MIRDRLVVGIRDEKLAERLQMDPELTVEKAIGKARQAEAVKQQQGIVRGTAQSEQQDTHVERIMRMNSKKEQR